ncbi:helitron helicase-like domain-containing protein [Tanacetum coccineum]
MKTQKKKRTGTDRRSIHCCNKTQKASREYDLHVKPQSQQLDKIETGTIHHAINAAKKQQCNTVLIPAKITDNKTPTYRYNFKAAVTDGTENAQFTFFTNAGYKITGHPCTQLAQKYQGAGEFTVDDILDIYPAIKAPNTDTATSTSKLPTTEESTSRSKCIAETRPRDIIEEVAHTVVTTIPAHKSKTEEATQTKSLEQQKEDTSGNTQEKNKGTTAAIQTTPPPTLATTKEVAKSNVELGEEKRKATKRPLFQQPSDDPKKHKGD